ncbi:hypothetical protein SK128_008908, partial [Halocaridina rubra]
MPKMSSSRTGEREGWSGGNTTRCYVPKGNRLPNIESCPGEIWCLKNLGFWSQIASDQFSRCECSRTNSRTWNQKTASIRHLISMDACESPANWLYADGSQCSGNSFCDWLQEGSNNEWNALPKNLFGASIAAMLDDFPDTDYRHKLQPYPADHTLNYMICEKDGRLDTRHNNNTNDSTDHLKPRELVVSERLSDVQIDWQRPSCAGEISSYILVLLGGSVSYDTEMKCVEAQCSFTLNPEVCNHCIHPNTDYTFSVAAVLADSQLGPAITINKKI